MQSTYVDLSEADTYMEYHLDRYAWDRADGDRKLAALYEATSLIDLLRLRGEKKTPTQILQFPRLGQTSVPNDVRAATVEIAVALIKGIDPQREYNLAHKTSVGYGPLRQQQDPARMTPEYIAAGIPSKKGFDLIYKYIVDPYTVELVRST